MQPSHTQFVLQDQASTTPWLLLSHYTGISKMLASALELDCTFTIASLRFSLGSLNLLHSAQPQSLSITPPTLECSLILGLHFRQWSASNIISHVSVAPHGPFMLLKPVLAVTSDSAGSMRFSLSPFWTTASVC